MELMIDFGGFYESIHGHVIESQIERDLDYILENDRDDDLTITEIEQQHWDNVEWTPTYNNYGEAYVDRLNNVLSLDLKLNGIHSPRFYNFTNDKLLVEINNSDVEFLFNDINHDNHEFVDYINERLKTRDGFHSYYDDGITSPFVNIYERAQCGSEGPFENLLELYIEFLIDANDINEDIYELEYEIKYF